MTSGIRVCESHIQASLPLTNQHPEVTNSLRRWQLFRGTFCLPLSCASSAICAALDGHWGHDCGLGFPSLLRPEVTAQTDLQPTDWHHGLVTKQCCLNTAQKEENSFLRLNIMFEGQGLYAQPPGKGVS